MPRKSLLILFALISAPLWAQEIVPQTQPAETRPAPPPMPAPVAKTRSWWDDNFIFTGEVRQETAVRVSNPQNFSKLKEMLKLNMKFVFNDHYKLKIGGRAWVDAVYDLTDQYPNAVVSNMRAESMLRDAYLDITYPYISIRVGHQQIVWGEALGQFFGDVVTPKDLREFFLPSFDDIRLPIWAIDAQYNFIPNATLEVVLSPDRTVSKLALPGADFSFRVPPVPGVEPVLLNDNRPDTDFKHWNAGVRVSALVSGWDFAVFYYTSPDHLPALAKTATVDAFTARPLIILDPIHERIHTAAGTFSKGIGNSIIVRGELVYTANKLFNTKTPAFNRGLEDKGQFRYVAGFDYDIGGHLLLNSEFQQEAILGSMTSIADPRLRSWMFFRLSSHFFDNKLVPQLIAIIGLNGGDTHFGPRLSYDVTDTINLTWGADIFSGPNDQLYGQFDGQDRLFMNSQWRF